MDTTILSAMAGVFGSLVGGSATVATAWITQRTLNRRRLVAAEIRNRQNLYGEFINECSARALDSFENTLDKSERLLSIYALLNRIRICASDTVLSEAERALASITEHTSRPISRSTSYMLWCAMVPDRTRFAHSPKRVARKSDRCPPRFSSARAIWRKAPHYVGLDVGSFFGRDISWSITPKAREGGSRMGSERHTQAKPRPGVSKPRGRSERERTSQQNAASR
jgi:hypothetical protein